MRRRVHLHTATRPTDTPTVARITDRVSVGGSNGSRSAAHPGCPPCERVSCPQRAFPRFGRELDIDDDRGRTEPYPPAEPGPIDQWTRQHSDLRVPVSRRGSPHEAHWVADNGARSNRMESAGSNRRPPPCKGGRHGMPDAPAHCKRLCKRTHHNATAQTVTGRAAGRPRFVSERTRQHQTLRADISVRSLLIPRSWVRVPDGPLQGPPRRITDKTQLGCE